MSDATTKSCIKCNQNKPLTEFYTHPSTKDGHLNCCKPCFIAIAAARKKHPKDKAVNAGEILAIDKLKSVGIHAVPGKMTEYKYQDVVAAEIVRVEVKKATIRGGKYLFKFDNQVYTGMRSHVVILICDDGLAPTFHVFPSDHPVFFNRTGQRKMGVHYQPFAKHRKHGNNHITPELMLVHKDKWSEIETARRQIIGIAA
jgi:hypothetical protein